MFCRPKGKRTDETKRSISLSLIGNVRAAGHLHTDDWKQNKRIQMKKYRASNATKKRMSDVLMGRVFSDETKRKMRVSKLKRLETLGISPREDAGAASYFQYQNEQGFRFIENYKLTELGYVVDGYDPYLNIVCEYDTKYHKITRQQRRDSIRQDRIIKYFVSIGKPLSHFVRVDAIQFPPTPL